ncbi:MAG: DNA-3-methyladenine glycosylase I [Thaumarchaeota archaeon]|nr:DNA-3-methyladenine glycosylase I [Nitrososphaerota archaeon]
MPTGGKVTRPKDDAGYFERMSKTLFTAGLSWTMVEKKWPNFQKAFAGFSPEKVAKMTQKDVKSLMSNDGIVKNERKIKATIQNANEFLKLKKDFGSFREYLDSLGKDETALQSDLQKRFQHVGPSTARMFLWSVGHKLTPTAEEKKWMAKEA